MFFTTSASVYKMIGCQETRCKNLRSNEPIYFKLSTNLSMSLLNACDFFVHFLSWVWSVVTLSQDNFAGRDFQFQKIQFIILTMVLNQNPNSFFSQNCDHMKMKRTNVNFSEKIGLIFINLSSFWIMDKKSKTSLISHSHCIFK